jgi:hypothetical protein
MVGSVRSLADRLLERLVPATQSQAVTCVIAYWDAQPCQWGGGYSKNKMEVCSNGKVTYLGHIPCNSGGGGGTCGGWPLGSPTYPCPGPSTPCVPNTPGCAPY